MKSLFPLCISGVCLFAAGPVKAASEYVETFSTANDASGWYQLSTGTADTLAQDPLSGTLAFSATDYGLLFVSADATSSGGAFVGDYPSAGITWFTFDLNLTPSSAASGLALQLANFTGDETWQYDLAVPAPGSTTSYSIPLDPGGAGWLQVTGGESFGFLLSQTEELSIVFSNDTTGSLSGFIDNVAAIPEPSSLLLGALGLLAVRARRRPAA